MDNRRRSIIRSLALTPFLLGVRDLLASSKDGALVKTGCNIASMPIPSMQC